MSTPPGSAAAKYAAPTDIAQKMTGFANTVTTTSFVTVGIISLMRS